MTVIHFHFFKDGLPLPVEGQTNSLKKASPHHAIVMAERGSKVGQIRDYFSGLDANILFVAHGAYLRSRCENNGKRTALAVPRSSTIVTCWITEK